MSPEAHLVDTWWFRQAVFLPVLLAIVISWIFTGDTILKLDQSPEGMNFFLQTFKLPIGIASLALPMVAIVASHHRSVQAAQQIREQSAQNIFSNHLEHRRYFMSYCEESRTLKNKDINPSKLYEFLFRQSSAGNLQPQMESIDLLKSRITTTSDIIYKGYTTQIKEDGLAQHNEYVMTAASGLSEHLEHKTGIKRQKTNLDGLMIPEFTEFSSILTYLTQTLLVIEVCSNFHRDYLDHDDIKKTYENLDNHTREINRYNIPVMLAESIFRAIKATNIENSLSRFDPQRNADMIGRLHEIDKNIELNKISHKDLSLALSEFKSWEIKFVSINCPDSWRNLITT